MVVMLQVVEVKTLDETKAQLVAAGDKLVRGLGGLGAGG